jgi:hypothetical protein
MSHLLLVPHFAGGLLVWPLYCLIVREKGPVSKHLFQIFLITAVVLSVLAGKIILFGDPTQWGIGFFPFINFGSVLCSATTRLRMYPEEMKERFERPRVAAACGVGFVVTAMMFMFGFRSFDILLHEARATAAVTGGHRGISYQFEASGRTWTGGGDPGNPPYPIGSTFEIRYSSAHPFFSTAQPPLTFLGQMAVGSAFVGLGVFGITNSAARAKARRSNPT